MSILAKLKGHIHRIILGEGRDFGQQRRHSRILCSVPVHLKFTDHYTPGTLVDLSLDGARVQIAAVPNRLGVCRAPYQRGQKLKLVLVYNSKERDDRVAMVTIRWIRPSQAGWDLGVQIVLGGSVGWVPKLLAEYGLTQDAFHTRRRAIRTPTDQPITLNLGGVQTFPGVLIDLSLGGAAVVSPKAFARFIPLQLRLQLSDQTTVLPTQVVHTRPHDDPSSSIQSGWLCGLRFRELTRAQGELIGRHLVESRRSR